MAASIDLKLGWDPAAIAKWSTGPIDKAVLSSLQAEASRIGRELLEGAVRYVVSKKSLPEAFVRKGLKLEQPRNGAPLAEQIWKLTVSGKSVALSKYPYERTSFGVAVKVNQGKGKKLRSAFVATVGAGHVGIFVRKGEPRRRGPKGSDLPIRELYSSTLAHVLSNDEVASLLFAPAEAAMAKAMADALGSVGR